MGTQGANTTEKFLFVNAVTGVNAFKAAAVPAAAVAGGMGSNWDKAFKAGTNPEGLASAPQALVKVNSVNHEMREPDTQKDDPQERAQG